MIGNIKRSLFYGIMLVLVFSIPSYSQNIAPEKNQTRVSGSQQEEATNVSLEQIENKIKGLNSKIEVLQTGTEVVQNELEKTGEKVNILGILRQLYVSTGFTILAILIFIGIGIFSSIKVNKISDLLSEFEEKLRGRPAITGINPIEGSLFGGDKIDITGINFQNLKRISIGDVPAKIKNRSRNEIQIESPPANILETEKRMDIEFYTDQEPAAIFKNYFRYYWPTLEVKKDKLEIQASGGEVSIKGKNFGENTIVEISGKPLEIKQRSVKLLLINIPAGKKNDKVNIKIKREDGESKNIELKYV